MDINFLRGIFTLIVMIGFIGMVIWVYSRKRRAHYDDAANSIFKDEKHPGERKNNE